MRHVTGKHNEHLASASSVVLQKRAWSFSTIRDRAQFAETIHLKWRDFEPAIILCAVRWDLRYSLSYRDVRELLVEQESARKSGVCCAAYLRE